MRNSFFMLVLVFAWMPVAPSRAQTPTGDAPPPAEVTADAAATSAEPNTPAAPNTAAPNTAAPTSPPPMIEAPAVSSPPVQLASAESSAPALDTCCRRRRGDAEGAGTFMLGVAFVDVADLNDHLEAAGYETVSSTMAMIGGEGRAVLRSGFVIGGHGAALLGSDVEGPGEFQASLSGGYGMADLGFAFVHTRNALLTLTAGIGGYGFGLHLSERNAAPFDDVLRNPGRSETLASGGVLMGLTVGFDGRVPVGDRNEEGTQPFFTLGVRAGAMYGPPIADWSLSDGSTAKSGPSTQLLSAYLALVVGFGGGPVDENGNI